MALPRKFAFAALILIAFSAPSVAQQTPGSALGALAAEHTAKPAKGHAGLIAVPLRVTNTGEAALACELTFAHWYSAPLATVAPGAQLVATLWSDPKDGAVVALNAADDQVAVERVWCGQAGKSWETRFEMPLARRAGAVEAPLLYRCAAGAQKLACRAE